jgi:hypothetical protein
VALVAGNKLAKQVATGTAAAISAATVAAATAIATATATTIKDSAATSTDLATVQYYAEAQWSLHPLHYWSCYQIM